MDNNKIAFIICTNREDEFNEAKKYINNLRVPDDCSIEIVPIVGAKSMCSGYNEGMSRTDAKYKVYLHQDTYILNNTFIADILDIFSDESIGMIGMVGNTTVPSAGVMWYEQRYGRLYACESMGVVDTKDIIKVNEKLMDVSTIDGFIMITSYDIKWREDLFEDWDFYDISQCMEMKKSGKRIVLPVQNHPWCIHNSGCVNLEKYFVNRERFVEEYL